MPHQIDIECDVHTQKLLARYFEKHKAGANVHFASVDNAHINVKTSAQEKAFLQPVRLGDVLDYLNLCEKRDKNTAIITFDGATLNTELGLFIRTDEEGISLTEKEVEILTFLSAQSGESVSREKLLDSVWGYAKDVETHTLETHVYRLRQKIEPNPTQPKFLQTAEEGYFVKVFE